VDVKGSGLFCAALGNNSVEVIDLASGKRAHSISGLQKPQGVLFLARVKSALRGGRRRRNAKIFDAANYKLLGNIGSLDMRHVRVEPDWPKGRRAMATVR